MDETFLALARGAFELSVQLRLWVAFCVSSLSMFCERLIQSRATMELVTSSSAIVFLSTLGVYNLDAAWGDPHEQHDGRGRRSVHAALSLLSTLGIIWHLGAVQLRASLPIVIGFFSCCLYAVRWGHAGASMQLKRIPGLKAPFIGCAVGCAVVLVPWLLHDDQHPGRGPLVALGLSLSCFCTANAHLFDFPDQERDRKNGVPTAPILWGRTVAHRVVVAWILAGVSAACAAPDVAQGPLFCLGAALLIVSLGWIGRAKKYKTAFWVDGALALPLLLQTWLG